MTFHGFSNSLAGIIIEGKDQSRYFKTNISAPKKEKTICGETMISRLLRDQDQSFETKTTTRGFETKNNKFKTGLEAKNVVSRTAPLAISLSI